MENGDNTGYLLKSQVSFIERQLQVYKHKLGSAAGDTGPQVQDVSEKNKMLSECVQLWWASCKNIMLGKQVSHQGGKVPPVSKQPEMAAEMIAAFCQELASNKNTSELE